MSNDLFLIVQGEKNDGTKDCFLLDSLPFVTRFQHQFHRIGVDSRVTLRHFRSLENHRQRFEGRFDRGEIARELERIFELCVFGIVTKRFVGWIRIVQVQHVGNDFFSDLSICISRGETSKRGDEKPFSVSILVKSALVVGTVMNVDNGKNRPTNGTESK